MADSDDPTTGITVDEPAAPHTVTLLARGEFDRENCDRLPTEVRAALATGRGTIVMDLGRVTFIDAATIRALLACREVAASEQGTFQVVNATGIVARVLDVAAAHLHDAAAGDPGRPPARTPPGPRRRSRYQHTDAHVPATSVDEVLATSAALIERAQHLVAENRRILGAIRVTGD